MLKNNHNVSLYVREGDVDDLLKEFKSELDITLYNVIENSEEFIKNIKNNQSLFLIDKDCMCNLGNNICKTSFSCFHCNLMKRLMNFHNQNTINIPFMIEFGDNSGSYLHIKDTKISKLSLKWDLENSVRARTYLSRYSNYNHCGTPKDISNMRNIKGDAFTINTIILWIIEKLFEKNKLNNYLKLYNSFICGKKGYQLLEYPKLGNFQNFIENRNLTSNDIKQIILQLLLSLKTLSNIHFAHGQPHFSNVYFKDQPCRNSISNIKINSNFTLVISNLEYSSVLLNDLHFSTESSFSELYLQRSIFTPDISIKSIPSKFCNKNNKKKNICKIGKEETYFYKLTNDTINIFDHIRHIGFPLFVGTFDFYCFFVSFMTCKLFYDKCMENDKLKMIWQLLWSEEDYDIVENRIKKYHSYNLNNIPLDSPAIIIKGLWLRCNILDYIQISLN